MVKILICDDDQTFAQSMFKRILSLPAYSSKSMKLSCLTDIAEMSADTIAQYDILFLDIDLGKESGIDLARKMRKMNLVPADIQYRIHNRTVDRQKEVAVRVMVIYNSGVCQTIGVPVRITIRIPLGSLWIGFIFSKAVTVLPDPVRMICHHSVFTRQNYIGCPIRFFARNNITG